MAKGVDLRLPALLDSGSTFGKQELGETALGKLPWETTLGKLPWESTLGNQPRRTYSWGTYLGKMLWGTTQGNQPRENFFGEPIQEELFWKGGESL